MTKDEALKLALEALERLWSDGFEGYPAASHESAITAIKEALAEQPAQQEPYAWMAVGGTIWRHKTTQDDVPLYLSKPPRKTLTDEWVRVTESLLYAQHHWLYKPMWIAMKDGTVVQGYYEWRQGRNPDRFITDIGDEWAFNAYFVMPITKPAYPGIEAAQGTGEKA